MSLAKSVISDRIDKTEAKVEEWTIAKRRDVFNRIRRALDLPEKERTKL